MTIRLLLVDDQALVREGFRALLVAQADMQVVGEADDGEQAVAMALQLEPDIMLMDVRMPLMDGLEATERLLGQSTAQHRPRHHPHHLRHGRLRLSRAASRGQRLPSQRRVGT